MVVYPECSEAKSKDRVIMSHYFIYMMTNHNKKLLYVGMTDDLARRSYEHQTGVYKGFTSKYGVNIMVYYEGPMNLESAIAREKQLKKWRREKKNSLINLQNPLWQAIIFSIPKNQNKMAAINFYAPLENDPSATLGIKSSI